MQALLRFDDIRAAGAGLAPPRHPAWPSVAEALSLGMAPPAAAPDLLQLQERLVATLALASQRPHSAWRSRLLIAADPPFANGDARWQAVAVDPAATVLVEHASALLMPFFPHVDATNGRVGGK